MSPTNIHKNHEDGDCSINQRKSCVEETDLQANSTNIHHYMTQEEKLGCFVLKQLTHSEE